MSINIHELSVHVAEDVEVVDKVTVENVVRLLENDNTVAFIARYRRETTGNLEVEKIREIHESWTQVKCLEARKVTIVKAIGDKLTPEIESNLKFARTLPDVEEIYTPFKKGSKVTYANRARKLGLDKAAEMIQSNPKVNNLDMFVKPMEKGLSNTTEVATGIQHILADVISKDKDIYNILKGLMCASDVKMSTKKYKNYKKNDLSKYKDYFDNNLSINRIKAHQILAINRAEESKILHVKVNCPEHVEKRFLNVARGKCIPSKSSVLVRNLMLSTVDDCFHRLMLPRIIRHMRAELTKKAEQESVQIFSRNLRRLLLTPPLQGRVVLGIDPGFVHGCKLAVVNHNGDILDTGVIYPFSAKARAAEAMLQGLLTTHNCCTIALGSGKACRETEHFITKMKEAGKLNKDLVYSIVSEDGASIYSVSKEAGIEMPTLDVNIRSAVSIARRLQNPLLELIKIEPKHLGVGMYQHDLPDNVLKTALGGVLEDCVSLVGIDLNASGTHALRRIAGLNERKANQIIEWRKRNGDFSNRHQLKEVRGIGEKTFEQCVGFLRILGPRAVDTVVIDSDDEPVSGQVSGKRKAGERNVGNNKKRKHDNTRGFNKLDSTCIHPESYLIAKRIMSLAEASSCDIGLPLIKTKMDNLLKTQDITKLCQTLNSDSSTIRFIIDGLCQPSSTDIRADFAKPLFRRGILSMDDVKPNVKLTGRVANVTSFGAFVDIGVEHHGLIHTTKMLPGTFNLLGVGDTVEVNVEDVNVNRSRIGLRMLSVANPSVELR